MSRALLVAGLAALALAAPSAALLPPVPSGSAVGEAVPLKAYASISPPVNLFGDSVTARVAVVADTKWVDTARLRVTTDFRPFKAVSAPTIAQLGHGRFAQITWTWTLRCLTVPCVPQTRPTDVVRTFRIRPAKIDYLTTTGARAYGITASFPALTTLSQLNVGIRQYLASHNSLRFRFRLTPVAAPQYRLSPTLLFWLAVGLGLTLAAAAAVLAGRWALSLLPARAGAAPPGTPLERALALVVWARERGDESLQRKALERVADELAPDVHDLAETARALAWSKDLPEDEDVARISEQARREAALREPPAEEPR